MVARQRGGWQEGVDGMLQYKPPSLDVQPMELPVAPVGGPGGKQPVLSLVFNGYDDIFSKKDARPVRDRTPSRFVQEEIARFMKKYHSSPAVLEFSLPAELRDASVEKDVVDGFRRHFREEFNSTLEFTRRKRRTGLKALAGSLGLALGIEGLKQYGLITGGVNLISAYAVQTLFGLGAYWGSVKVYESYNTPGFDLNQRMSECDIRFVGVDKIK